MSYVLEVLPALLNGAVVTLQVFFIVIVLSIPLGIVLAFLMQIKFKPLNWLLTLYVWIMRGTPLLLQLIFVYYVLPSVGIVFDRLPAAILAFTLNYAAYFAEIYRSGIESMPVGQYEAAEILGYSKSQTFLHIVLPLIAPTGGIIAILCAINSLKVFDIVKTMTEGGPYYATDVIATYVYRTAFSSEVGMPRLGYASAAALFFGGAVIIIGLLLNVIKGRLQKKAQ